MLLVSRLPGTVTLNPFSYIFFYTFFSSFSIFFNPADIEFIFCLFFYAKLFDESNYCLFYFLVPFTWGWFTVHLVLLDSRFDLFALFISLDCCWLDSYTLGFDPPTLEFLFSKGLEFIFASYCFGTFYGIYGNVAWLYFLNLGSFSFS